MKLFGVILLISNILIGITLYPAIFQKKQIVASPVVETIHEIDSNKLQSLVNQWRKTNDYPQYIKSPGLCNYARERLEEIKTDWSHDQFMSDSCNKTPFNYCGENLSRGYLYEEQTLQAWLDSPTHRENIEKDFVYMCVECKDGYCSQQFGK